MYAGIGGSMGAGRGVALAAADGLGSWAGIGWPTEGPRSRGIEGTRAIARASREAPSPESEGMRESAERCLGSYFGPLAFAPGRCDARPPATPRKLTIR